MLNSKKQDNMKNGLKIAGALLVGAAAGILLAPKSGKETRKDIADKANQAKDSLDEKLASITSKAKELVGASSNGKS